LLVITDGKDMAMPDCELTDDGVLNAIQILKLVDEDGIPASSQLRTDRGDTKKLRRFQHQHIEIGHVSASHDVSILVVNFAVSPAQRLIAKAVSRESFEHTLAQFLRDFQVTQNCQLIVVISDPEAELQTNLLTELAEQLGTKSVDGSALNAFYAYPELALEPFGDLARRFICKREYAYPRGIDPKLVDEEADTLDQAESFSCARSGEHEDRLGGRFDCCALRCRRNARNGCGIGASRCRCSD
jgi:hypothetical protein